MEHLMVACEEKKSGVGSFRSVGNRGSNDQVGPFIGGGWVQTSSAVALFQAVA